jgi:antitoxin (DNA-binding transcriptional repressor) of toxin-antitoxin stability system
LAVVDPGHVRAGWTGNDGEADQPFRQVGGVGPGAEAGEEIELTRYGRAVARVVGPKPEKRQPLIGCMTGRFEAPHDIHDGDAEVAALFMASAVSPQ